MTTKVVCDACGETLADNAPRRWVMASTGVTPSGPQHGIVHADACSWKCAAAIMRKAATDIEAKGE